MRSGMWILACLLPLVMVNTLCVVASFRSRRAPRDKQGAINLTHHATRDYFLHKLEDATLAAAAAAAVATSQSSATQSSSSAKVLTITVHSDVPGVRVNFRTETPRSLGSKQSRQQVGTYRYAYNKSVTVALNDEVFVKSQIQPSKQGAEARVLPSLVATFYENSVIEGNADLKAHVAAVARRTKHKNGRYYILYIHACLKLGDPTDCYFYWHPIDGIIALAISNIHGMATMYQADWKSIATKAKMKSRSYCILNSYFTKVEEKNLVHFINVLKEMKQSNPPMFPIHDVVAQSYTSKYRKVHFALNPCSDEHLDDDKEEEEEEEEISSLDKLPSSAVGQSNMSNANSALSLNFDQHPSVEKEKKHILSLNKPFSPTMGQAYTPTYNNIRGSSNLEFGQHSNMEDEEIKDISSWNKPLGQHFHVEEENKDIFSWSRQLSPITRKSVASNYDKMRDSSNFEYGQHSNVEEENNDISSWKKPYSPWPKQRLKLKHDPVLGAWNLGPDYGTDVEDKDSNVFSWRTLPPSKFQHHDGHPPYGGYAKEDQHPNLQD